VRLEVVSHFSKEFSHLKRVVHLAENRWYILAENEWYILAENRWYIDARKLTSLRSDWRAPTRADVHGIIIGHPIKFAG
jgi:hypothetical protein